MEEPATIAPVVVIGRSRKKRRVAADFSDVNTSQDVDESVKVEAKLTKTNNGKKKASAKRKPVTKKPKTASTEQSPKVKSSRGKRKSRVKSQFLQLDEESDANKTEEDSSSSEKQREEFALNIDHNDFKTLKSSESDKSASPRRRDRFTLEQRFEILKTYFQCDGRVAEAVRILKRTFGEQNAPTAPCIRKFIKKVRTIGMLIDNKSYPRVRPVRSSENIAAVIDSMHMNPRTSHRRRCQQLNISRTTLRRIMRKDLVNIRPLYGFKIQLTQALKAKDHPLRYRFAVWALKQLENDKDFAKKIIFSDEAHFHLGGFVYKENCRIWGSEHPRIIVEKPLLSDRVTVWCGFWSGGIIGPFFFENEDGENIVVNGRRYRDMLTKSLWPQIEKLNINELWFQQDGTAYHTNHTTIDFLCNKFNNRVISRFGDINWPPRSCDLTPVDFFLWGAIKDRCYVDNPETIQALKQNIVNAVAEIGIERIENVLKDWIERMEYCKSSRGSHLNEIIFHN